MIPPKIIKRTCKHVYSPAEKVDITNNLLNALSNQDTIASEFDSVKASYKAKISEAESQSVALATNLRNGFEMRTKDCKVVFRPKDRKKDYFVVETGEAVGTDDMTNDDMQQELLQAESAFEFRTELQLWAPQGNDKAVLVVGKMKGRWYSSLRLRVGVFELQERLDSEQKAFKEREDAIRTAGARCLEWLKANVKELAEGFRDSINKTVEAEIGKVE
jgi:hypothetical protein